MSGEVVELEHEVERLPQGWRSEPFSALADYVNGRAFKPEDWGTAGLPIIRIAQITNPDAETNFYNGEVDPRNLIDTGDLIFSWSATLAVMRWNKGPAVLNQHLFKVTPAKGIDRDWLQFRLEASIPDLADEAHGTTMKHIRKGTLSSKFTVVPPLDEQRRIAEVLRSVDEAIALSKETVEQAENASRGLLQRLFVEGIGHSDFKEGNSTSIPASWNEMSLNELSAIPITYGVVQPGPKVPNGVPFVRGGDFPNGKIDLGALRTISAEVAGQYRRTQLKGGEIVISLVGYPGACAVVPEALAGANIARQAALVRPKPEVTTSYLYQFLRSPIGQGRLKKETIGSAQQVINLRDLKEVIIAVPPLHEQKQIAAILGDLDNFVEMEMLNLNKLTALKASISPDLLSGHVRVPA